MPMNFDKILSKMGVKVIPYGSDMSQADIKNIMQATGSDINYGYSDGKQKTVAINEELCPKGGFKYETVMIHELCHLIMRHNDPDSPFAKIRAVNYNPHTMGAYIQNEMEARAATLEICLKMNLSPEHHRMAYGACTELYSAPNVSFTGAVASKCAEMFMSMYN